MSPNRLFTVGASVCLLLIGCACNPVADTKAEAKKIHKLNDEWISAIQAGNVDKIVNLFSATPLSMAKGKPLYTDASGIRKITEDMFSDPLASKSFKLTSDSLEVSASGDMAWNWGTQTSMQSNSLGNHEVSGKWLTLWKKIDGNWKVILDFGTELKTTNPPYSTPALVEELTKIEESWNEATLKKDAKTLDLILAEEYTYTDDNVELNNKQQSISDVTTGKTKFLAPAVLSDIQVSEYGPIAVVRGKNTVKATYNGKNTSGTYRFVDVFVWRDGRWQCVSTK